MARKMKTTRDLDAGTVTFEPVEGDGAGFTANINDLSSAIQTRLAIHGLTQVLADTYAGTTEPAAMVKAIGARYATLQAGEWSTRSGGGVGRVTLLLTALVNVTGKSIEDVTAFLDGLSKDAKANVGKTAAVKAELDSMKARAASDAAKASKKAASDAGDNDADALAGLVGN